MKDTWQFRKARMHQSPSTAEATVFTMLGNRIKLESLGSTVCFNRKEGLQVVPRERMTTGLWDRCMGSDGGFVTVPDFVYRPGKLAFYLDGEPHERSRVKLRDERIDKCLREFGWKPVRFPYRGRMGQARAGEIVAEMLKEVKGK